MEMTLKPGQKILLCLACGYERVSPASGHVLVAQCSECRSPFLYALLARPTRVSGTGQGDTADLGLAILMEAQTNV